MRIFLLKYSTLVKNGGSFKECMHFVLYIIKEVHDNQ